MAMMFRGLGKPTDQLNISIAPTAGGFGAIDPGMSMPSQMPAPAAVPQKRGASFAGIAADFLAGMAGQQGPYAANVARHNELLRRAQEQQQQRMADREDWLWKAQWERDNPKPINNDTASDFEYIKGILGESSARQWLQNKTDPIVSVPVPGGTYMGPRSGMGAVAKGGDDTPSIGNGAPQAAVDYLRKNPSLADQFDAKYGRGAAAAILQGGAPSQGGATFP